MSKMSDISTIISKTLYDTHLSYAEGNHLCCLERRGEWTWREAMCLQEEESFDPETCDEKHYTQKLQVNTHGVNIHCNWAVQGNWHSLIPLFGAEAEGYLGSTREGILFAQQKLLELLLHLSAGDCTCEEIKRKGILYWVTQKHNFTHAHTHKSPQYQLSDVQLFREFVSCFIMVAIENLPVRICLVVV